VPDFNPSAIFPARAAGNLRKILPSIHGDCNPMIAKILF
jgi:hypothetical protein